MQHKNLSGASAIVWDLVATKPNHSGGHDPNCVSDMADAGTGTLEETGLGPALPLLGGFALTGRGDSQAARQTSARLLMLIPMNLQRAQCQ